MVFPFYRTPQPSAWHTKDICTETGLYVALHCTPRFEREFQAGDEFTRCPHGQATSWRLADRRRLTKANVSTFTALAAITAAALFLIWPEEISPEAIRNAHVPFLYEARQQAHSILLLFASQAMLFFILSTRQPKSVLAIWAIISAASLPFAAELNSFEQNSPTHNLVVICSCAPILVKMLGHLPTGKTAVGTLSLLVMYSCLIFALVAVIVNTKMGPILAIVFGRDVIEGGILFLLLGATIIGCTAFFILIGAARGRLTAFE